MRGRHAAPPRWQVRLQPVLPAARNGPADQAVATTGRPTGDCPPEPQRSRQVLTVRVKPTEAAGLGIIAVLVVFCFAGPLFYRADLTHVNLTLTNLAPSARHPLGTDPDGVDVLGRLMTGGQLSLEVGMAAGILASIIGSLWGATAGYLGGVADAVMMRLVDAAFAIPAVVLLLLLSAVYTPSPALLILVIAATSWLGTARLVRGAALTLRTREFVQAVKTMGGGRTRTIVRHIAPNALGLIAVNVSFQIADAIVVLATLSYLGLGVQPPSSDWGDMIAAGVPLIYSGYWWEIYPAGIAIISVVIAFNLLGDALSDRLETAGRRH
jgi:peptide/nickel transport system permease protein